MLCVIFRISLPVCFYCSQEKYNAISGGGGGGPTALRRYGQNHVLLPSRAITYAEKAASRAITYAEKAASRAITYAEKAASRAITYAEKASRAITYAEKAAFL